MAFVPLAVAGAGGGGSFFLGDILLDAVADRQGLVGGPKLAFKGGTKILGGLVLSWAGMQMVGLPRAGLVGLGIGLALSSIVDVIQAIRGV